MTFFALLLVSLSLAMDAMAIAVSNGVAYAGERKQVFIAALSFGVAQAAMPVLGYLAGSGFSQVIESFDHWLAFILLAVIGGKMIFEAMRELCREKAAPPRQLSGKLLFTQAVATSVDALVVGVGFAALHTDIITASATIGVVTFFLCLIGGVMGQRLGCYLQRYAALFGGVILICIGSKILIEHLGVM